MAELIYNLANWLPLGYAFGAGMVATVNPCGFLMLPAYIAYYLGTDEKYSTAISAPARGTQGIVLGLTMTSGFVVFFSTIGLGVSLSGQALLRLFPVAGLVIGLILAAFGLWLLIRGGSLGLAAASRVRITFKKNLLNAFLFGIAYAVASLSCTLPIFLLVVGSALATQGMAAGTLQFVGYSLGMGFLVIAVILGTVFFKGTVNRYLRRAMPYVHELSAVFLVGAGVYLVFYWLRSGVLF